MKLLVISDWYDNCNDPKTLQNLSEQGEISMVCTLGDLSPDVYRDVGQYFPGLPKMAVMGNHDTKFSAPFAKRYGFALLHLTSVDVGNLTLAGFDGSLRYKEGEGYMWTQEEARVMVGQLPSAQILLAHSPPYSVYHPSHDPQHTGLKALDDYIEQHSPQLLLCGHLHAKRIWQVGQTEVRVVFGIQIVEVEVVKPI